MVNRQLNCPGREKIAGEQYMSLKSQSTRRQRGHCRRDALGGRAEVVDEPGGSTVSGSEETYENAGDDDVELARPPADGSGRFGHPAHQHRGIAFRGARAVRRDRSHQHALVYGRLPLQIPLVL